MQYFSIFFKEFNKLCVTLLRVWRKNTIYWKVRRIKRAFSRAISCGPAWVISQFTSQRDNCINWYKRDRGPPTGLPPCPKTLDIARNAGNFQQDISPNMDYFHPGAYMCFRTRRPTTNHHEQQCCYLENGALMLSPPAAGSADWTSPSKSFLGHWHNDVHPWCLCCKNIESYYCGLYYKRRPANDGSR